MFPEDTPIQAATIARLWRQLQPALSQTDCEYVVVDLARLALLERDATSKLVTLHDLLYDYTRTKLNGQLAEIHNALLTSYNPNRKPWAEIPDDGYLYRHLAYHLREAGRQQELENLLSDFPWLQTKLDATDVNAILADYDLLPDDAELRLVQGALRLSAHVLAHDPVQLRGQFYARILTSPEPHLQHLREQAGASASGPWIRGLQRTLTPPGGPLLRTLAGHSGWVTAITVTPDGRYGVSGSDDDTLKVWELSSGQEVRTLMGHSAPVSAITVTPDGRYGVSGSADTTLKVWELSTGHVVATFTAESPILCCAVASDGRTIVAGDSSGRVHFLRLEGVR